jgi:hypothetical protein
MRKLGSRVQHLVSADELCDFTIYHRIERLLGNDRGGECKGD